MINIPLKKKSALPTILHEMQNQYGPYVDAFSNASIIQCYIEISGADLY